ncbi:MAG: hypothetical protein V4722_18490 [Bacteroidota bacterium]
MAFKLFLTGFILLLHLQSTGQGVSLNGLKTGIWTETNPTADDTLYGTGNYIIIPLDSYKIIRTIKDDFHEVRYGASNAYIAYSKRSNGKISVKDSNWNWYDAANNIRKITHWSKGIHLWTKYFDAKGNIAGNYYDDYDHDASVELTYIKSRLFKKEIYSFAKSNGPRVYYYPDDSLQISNAEFRFSIHFLKRPEDHQQLMLTSVHTMVIKSIEVARQSIVATVNKKPVVYPLTINPGKPVVVTLSTKPGAANFIPNDTIIITTASNQVYTIYAANDAAHIDYQNVEKLKTIQLSKTRDRYLFVASLGTVTTAWVTGINNLGRSYNISHPMDRRIQIDLAEFPPGTFRLEIISCNKGGSIQLVIKE